MNPEFSDWNDAIDEYTRYDEDIALMKGMGFNFYRFSICWSRIIPNGTLDEPVNEEGVKFYSDLIDKLLADGIEPMITLGSYKVRVLGDDWTAVTIDGKPAAHFEHTVVVTENGPEILTMRDEPRLIK